MPLSIYPGQANISETAFLSATLESIGYGHCHLDTARQNLELGSINPFSHEKYDIYSIKRVECNRKTKDIRDKASIGDGRWWHVKTERYCKKKE